MPDETVLPDGGDDTEGSASEPVGSDTETADTGDDGVTEPVSPAGKSEPGPVPYSRFKEVNDERNQLLETLQRRTADAWQEFQSRKQQQPQEPVFDQDTDKRLEEFIRNKVSPDTEMTKAQVAQVTAALTELKVAKRNPDWEDLKPVVLDEYKKVAEHRFSGEEMTQLIIDALKFRSGKPQREAAEQARRREDTKLRAAGPRGSAEHTTEVIDWDDPKVDINEYIERVKAGKMP